MLFYLILIIGIILSFGKNKDKNAKIFLIIMLILAMFRYGIGADYFAYKYLYQNIMPTIFQEIQNGVITQEIGFRIIGAFLKQIGISYQIYLALFSTITLIFIYKICKKYSSNPVFSLTIFYSFYYFVWVFSGIRQGLVLSVGVYYLLENLSKDKPLKLMIIFLLLSLIHSSAIILFLYYFSTKIKFDKKQIVILIIVSIIIGNLPINTIILKLSTNFSLFGRLLPYITKEIITFFNFQTIGRLIFIIIILINYDKYIKKYPSQKKILNIYLFSFILYFCFKFSELTAARLAIYGRILDMIILPNIIYTINKMKDKILYFFVILLVIIFYFTKEIKTMKIQSGLVSTHPVVIPYTNVFNSNKYKFDNMYYYLTK